MNFVSDHELRPSHVSDNAQYAALGLEPSSPHFLASHPYLQLYGAAFKLDYWLRPNIVNAIPNQEMIQSHGLEMRLNQGCNVKAALVYWVYVAWCFEQPLITIALPPSLADAVSKRTPNTVPRSILRCIVIRVLRRLSIRFKQFLPQLGNTDTLLRKSRVLHSIHFAST